MKKVSLTRQDGVGLFCIQNPPVNALSPQVILELRLAYEEFRSDRALKALLVYCDGTTFVAGGDISAFDEPDFSTQPMNTLLRQIEDCDRPVIASLHGTVLGGGLELALACHWRVAGPTTWLGFPEVSLGLLPGSLGTQRLPRVVGAAQALDMILHGQSVSADEALDFGLIDAIGVGTPLEAGLRFTQIVLSERRGPRRSCDGNFAGAELAENFFAAARQRMRHKAKHRPALGAVIDCVEAAVIQGFDEGEALERRLFDECRRSAQSAAMRHLFFAQRAAVKIPGLPAGAKERTVLCVGILGAGTMGSGIAMAFANAGFDAVITDVSPQGLSRGMSRIRSAYEASVARGRMNSEEAERRFLRIRGMPERSELGECDLVIEAVFEDMAVKKEAMVQLGRLCKPRAIIATNTSTLDVDALAQVTGRPTDVVGMHFFSPANVMRLLEIVRGAATSPDVLRTVVQLAKRIGKSPVVSGVCYGFIGNRMAEVYMREAEFLLMEGASPSAIDGAAEEFGLAMGPCRMLDMAGIDVGAMTVIEREKAGGLPPDPSYRAVVRKLFELGRHGQKTGAGYYRYEGTRAVPDPFTDALCRELAALHQVPHRAHIGDEEIVERLMFPLINEGYRILDEGIAYRPGDIDVVWTSGYGFPDFRGGPMYMAEKIGRTRLLERLRFYAVQCGNAFGYWTPSRLLETSD